MVLKNGKTQKATTIQFEEVDLNTLPIQRATQRAMKKMQAFYGGDWPHEPVLHVEENERFEASIAHDGDLALRIATGCLTKLERLQTSTSAIFDIETALEWLILHELHHADLGHFEMLEGVPILHLVTRASATHHRLDEIPSQDWPKIAPCLELQADHDALETLLGSFDGSSSEELRRIAISNAAVMVVIELADEDRRTDHTTHPKAATRIFQLLGHVSEMWAIPSQMSGAELPDHERIQTFSREVILPAYFDALALAQAANAQSIVADLGEPEDFFGDIAHAKLGRSDELVTEGAQEWAKLWPVNEALKPILGGHFTN